MIPARPQRTGFRDASVVWLLFALTALAVFFTYWRIPAPQLWNVSHSGIAGGAGRALVFLSFSPALAAIAILPFVVDRLGDLRATALALISFFLCATVAVPGVQTESDLDLRWANLPAVVGVGLAFALTVWTARRGRRTPPEATPFGDRARIAVGAVALFFAAPYVAAELGFFLDGVPLLGRIFQTGAIRPEPGTGELHPAVHHGHHHGMDGLLLTLTALLLSRDLSTLRRPLTRGVTAFYLALMLVYGLTNEAEDLWTEQVVKRDWTRWQIPNVLHPTFSAAWAAMVAAAIAIDLVCFGAGRRGGYRLPEARSSIHSDIGT